ncbi:limbic system-associated membrane protein-like isoform X1 [Vespula pensylvanica]|uniref:limbic system-associated membrane protein-like isoform X1 n=1 Tax=Vespula pensylvanica TaxID=30213 RepID=UPI001CBA4653|nr:limbic system-associated membrane protein-like isoform X1 [Vespula pensylvanica]
MNGERSVKRVTGMKDSFGRLRILTITFLIVVVIGRARTDNSSLNSGNQIITLLSRLPSVLRSSSVVPIAKPRCQRPLYAHRKSKRHVEEVPTFNNSISNVTVAVGREAVLTCVVSNLSGFKVAWLRVDTQTILTIANHVITKNDRIKITHSEHKMWYLHIRDVNPSDQGYYMCQINTEPMKSQTGFLEVVVPPDILDNSTSTDMVVKEGSNVTLRCAARGSPQPNITWKREDGELISLGDGQGVSSIEGSIFNIMKVNRLQMGAYLCIASNSVPPTVSKRIMLIVHFPPMIWIQNQLVGVQEGQQMTLECNSEAFPKSINYWTRGNNQIIPNGEKYEPTFSDNTYKVHMKLTIRSVTMSDYGIYKCISKNSLGETDGSISLYHIPTTTTQVKTTTTTPMPTIDKVETMQRTRQKMLPSLEPNLNEITDASLSTIIRNENIRTDGRHNNNDYINAENKIDKNVQRKNPLNKDVNAHKFYNTSRSISSRGDRLYAFLQHSIIIYTILLSILS